MAGSIGLYAAIIPGTVEIQKCTRIEDRELKGGLNGPLKPPPNLVSSNSAWITEYSYGSLDPLPYGLSYGPNFATDLPKEHSLLLNFQIRMTLLEN